MQAHPCRRLARLEIPSHGVGNHALKVGEGVALGRDTPATRIVPTRNESAGLRAGFDFEGDFPAGKATAPDAFVNVLECCILAGGTGKAG